MNSWPLVAFRRPIQACDSLTVSRATLLCLSGTFRPGLCSALSQICSEGRAQKSTRYLDQHLADHVIAWQVSFEMAAAPATNSLDFGLLLLGLAILETTRGGRAYSSR